MVSIEPGTELDSETFLKTNYKKGQNFESTPIFLSLSTSFIQASFLGLFWFRLLGQKMDLLN